MKMIGSEISERIKSRLHPEPYDVDISPSARFDFLIQSKAAFFNGKYVVGFTQLHDEMSLDHFLSIRSEAKKLTKSMWLFREKGIYLIICGSENNWKKHTDMILADKTGLHSLIVNAVHFIDPQTGRAHLSTSSWGSVEFGDTERVSKIVEDELNGTRSIRVS